MTLMGRLRGRQTNPEPRGATSEPPCARVPLVDVEVHAPEARTSCLPAFLRRLKHTSADVERALAHEPSAPLPTHHDDAYVSLAQPSHEQQYALLLAGKQSGWASFEYGVDALLRHASAALQSCSAETRREAEPLLRALEEGMPFTKRVAQASDRGTEIALRNDELSSRGDVVDEHEGERVSRALCDALAHDVLARIGKPGFERMAFVQGTPIHAVLLDVLRRDDGTLTLRVYNSGGGLKAHLPVPEGRAALHTAPPNPLQARMAKYPTMLEVNDVVMGPNGKLTKEALSDALMHAVHVTPRYLSRKQATREDASRADSARFADKVRALGSENKDLSGYALQSAQKAGNCVVECTFAMLRNNMSPAHFLELKSRLLAGVLAHTSFAPPRLASPKIENALVEAKALLLQKKTRVDDKRVLVACMAEERAKLPPHVLHERTQPAEAGALLCAAGDAPAVLVYETLEKHPILVVAERANGVVTHLPVGLQLDAKQKRTGKLALVESEGNARFKDAPESFDDVGQLLRMRATHGFRVVTALGAASTNG